MHGVRRGSRLAGVASAEEARAAREQGALARRALALRRSADYSEDSLAAVARAVIANPDEYSLWAFRREALLRWLEEPADRFVGRWQAELDLAFAALQRQPKSYPAWQHRLWLLSSAAVTCAVPADVLERALDSEFAMSGVLLSRDGRNFHGWAHRMRVRGIAPATAGASAAEEVKFVTAKINDDFANYSAWHHRSVVLPVVHEGREGGDERGEFVAAELEFVRQAFYTEPDVQSAWFYHRWLLAGAPARGKKAKVREEVWREELAACVELLEIEPDTRWALHAQADLLTRLGRHGEAVDVYKRLIGIDPMRRGFYRAQIAKAHSL